MDKELFSKGPAALFRHTHPPVKNANVEYDEQLSLGQQLADRVTGILGSWPFIVIQSLILVGWVAVNAYIATLALTNPEAFKAWDPYPFILLNLVLSLEAAYAGPVVMMSQNRQSHKDRLSAQLDFEVNLKAEQELGVIIRHLAHQDVLIHRIIARLEELQNDNPK